jgi:flagellar basal body-associated protein FliL
MTVLLLVAAIVFLAVVIGVAVSAFVASVPVPENRQAPDERTADRERARAEALRKIAERARRQQQREASARISRGF